MNREDTSAAAHGGHLRAELQELSEAMLSMRNAGIDVALSAYERDGDHFTVELALPELNAGDDLSGTHRPSKPD